MQEFKFLSDNKGDGIIGAYNEEDLYVPVQLIDIYNGREFTISYFLLQNIRRKACRLLLLPNTADNDIEYQGLFSYHINNVQEVENRQLRYWATIWFETHTGLIPYSIDETIPL